MCYHYVWYFMFTVATISESYLYLYLHDLCVFFVCVLCIFYVYMGQVPAIKLMMMMTVLGIKNTKILLCITSANVDRF